MTNEIPVWNVKVPVIELVRAATAEEAVSAMIERLDRAGFDFYDPGPGPGGADAFESEPLNGAEVWDASSHRHIWVEEA